MNVDIKKDINQLRRHVMRYMTQGLGCSNQKMDIRNIKIQRVLISRPNGRLGNQLLMTPLVQETLDLFPGCTVDLFVKGNIAFTIFNNYNNVDQIITLPSKPFKSLILYLKVWIKLRNRKYDLVINAVDGSSSGRLSTKLAISKRKVFNLVDEELSSAFNDYGHMAKMPVYNLRKCFYGNMINIADKQIPNLSIQLDSVEKAKGKELLAQLVKNDKKVICIYTYATGEKCYSKAWWNLFYEKLKEKYGNEYNIIEILPIENISQIDFKSISYYSRDIREMASIIANSILFISADCGIMHLASASETITVGLFSVTNSTCYAPYNNKNIAIDTNGKTSEEILEYIGQAFTS